jgi:hypothetical protein
VISTFPFFNWLTPHAPGAGNAVEKSASLLE